MNWRFTLIDRNNFETVIDEPMGWDACEIEVKRDLDMHGIFFDYQGNDFIYHDVAMQLIKQEYDTYGVEGNITQVIEQKCGEEFKELYRGRLLFSKYQFTCSDECFVKIPMETTSDVMALRNRWDQKVNLLTTKSFDTITNLPPYAKLGFDLTLPSKGILLQNKAENTTVNSTPVNCVPVNDNSPGNANSEYGMIEISCNKTIAGEIGGFNVETQPRYTTASIWAGSQSTPIGNVLVPNLDGDNDDIQSYMKPLFISPLVNYSEGMPNFGQVTQDVEVDIHIEGKITTLTSKINGVQLILCRLPKDKLGEDTLDYEWLAVDEIYNTVFDLPENSVLNFTKNYFNSTLQLNNGDRLYFFISMYTYRTNIQINGGGDAWNVEFNAGSYIRMKTLSKVEASTAKVFMVNEALSRTVEAITDNKIKAYSEYFGRTDSQPYSHDDDGCGSLEVITKGLFIRKQENRIAGQPFAMTASMQDLWQGLEPIHHIGMGIESDTLRQGHNRLRIEPWKYFYKPNIILECLNINKIEKEVIENEHYSTFKFGYEKWEAEEYNGLDEFLTKRQYRTTLNQIKNDFSKLSKMIASGYALEITRRRANLDSKDWRYDNDNFIICCKRNNAGNIIVELGNILNPQNIIDPETIYNFRISPLRIAMKWLDKVLASYKTLNPTNKIIFMDGDGNYFATGLMESLFCRLENQSLIEKNDLSTSIFDDIDIATPLLRPERVSYDYHMSVDEFKSILNNPYGVIKYSSNCESGLGWIDKIKYKPEEGLANFKLIPKYN